jgi:hypothetical protein
MSNLNRSVRINAIAKILAGFRKHCMDLGGLFVASAKIAPADVITSLQEVIDAAGKVTAAAGARKAALDEEQRIVEKNAELAAAVRQFALTAFSNKADVLADFGLQKRARKVRTVEEKLQTVTKALATRTARGTKGRRQKQQIHGTATGAHPAPATPAAAPTATDPTPRVTPASPTPPATPPHGAAPNGGA